MRDSKWLLSKDALPHIGVPQAPAHRMRSFRLPSALSTELSARATELSARSELAPVIEATPREGSSEDARFKERTLTWFKLGEELERQEEAMAAEAEAMPPPRWQRIAAIAGGAVAVLTAALLLF